MSETVIINGRCLACLEAEDEDPSERDTCGCWCHDMCPACWREDCDGGCFEGEDLG